jgi:hypothetical protein
MHYLEIGEDGYFRFLCPNPRCKGRLKARPIDVGKMAHCLKCGRHMPIPAPNTKPQMATLPSAASASELPPTTGSILPIGDFVPVQEPCYTPIIQGESGTGSILQPLPPISSRLFPLIRIHKRQLIALYEDALVAGRVRKGIPLEEEHCRPEGRLGIRTLLQSRQEISWSQVRSASVAEPTWIPCLGPNWRFHVDAGSSRADFEIRSEDVGNVLRVFESFLPGRFTRLRGARHHLSARKSFFLLLFGIPAVLGALLGWAVGISETGRLVAGLVGALLGAIVCTAYVAFMATLFGLDPIIKRWRQRPRKKKPTRDLSGRQPFRSRRLGWVLKLAALAFLIGLPFGYIPLPPGYGGTFLGWLLGLLAVVPLYLGYRLSLIDPRTADETASQRPILYLRAFDDDHKTNLQPPKWWTLFMGVAPNYTGRGQSKWGLWLQGGWAGVVRKFFNMGVDTSEEQLAHYFSKLGPFVAIGRPGETFPSPGAQRIYVKEQEWPLAVLDRLSRCQGVVLQPAMTSGIWWEVEQTLARVEPFRILMCLVNFRDRPDDWEQFRLRLEPFLPVPLPRSIPFLDEFSFLYFERDWTPRVQRLSYRWPLSWPIKGDATDLDYTLGPFVQGMHGGDREPPRPPKRHAFQFAGVLSFMLVLQMALIQLAIFLPKLQSHDSDRSSGWETYQGNALRYSIKVPRNWKRQEPPADGADLHFVRRELIVSGKPTIVLQVFALPFKRIPPREFAVDQMDVLLRLDDRTRLVNEDVVLVRGQGWHRFDYYLPSRGLRHRCRFYSTERGTIVLHGSIGAANQDGLALLEEVFNSVQLSADTIPPWDQFNPR